jgi:hypothetical protein
MTFLGVDLPGARPTRTFEMPRPLSLSIYLSERCLYDHVEVASPVVRFFFLLKFGG